MLISVMENWHWRCCLVSNTSKKDCKCLNLQTLNSSESRVNFVCYMFNYRKSLIKDSFDVKLKRGNLFTDIPLQWYTVTSYYWSLAQWESKLRYTSSPWHIFKHPFLSLSLIHCSLFFPSLFLRLAWSLSFWRNSQRRKMSGLLTETQKGLL